MIFVRHSKIPIQAFTVSLSNQSSTAFGPGSVINGSVVLELSKPTHAQSIRVVFDCKEKDSHKCINTVFLVESYVWQAKGKESDGDEIPEGRHLFLFAIKLPSVNYPPSISEAQLGHTISYSIQGYFTAANSSQMSSNTVPITYYPLVNLRDLPSTSPSNGLTSKNAAFLVDNALPAIRVKAELASPSYCPGDVCVVRTTINNPTDMKISHVQVSLIATTKIYQGMLTPLETQNSEALINPSNEQNYKNMIQTLYSENIYVSIPKKAQDSHNIFRITIPQDCSPTTGSHISRTVDRTYNVVIKFPLLHSPQASRTLGKWSFSGLLAPSSPKACDPKQTKRVLAKEAVISVPVVITTVRTSQQLPPQLKISLPSFTDQPDLPAFISNNESPQASPISPMLDDGWSVPGSPLSTSVDALDNGHLVGELNNTAAKDATGHLMVPGLNETQRKGVSSQSSSSTDKDRHSIEAPQDSNSQVLVK